MSDAPSNGQSSRTPAKPVRILHLEDSAFDAELVQELLEDDGLVCEISRVLDRSNFEAILVDRQFDLIICDHGLPGYNGFAALEFAQTKQPNTPTIMLSG